MVIINDRKFYDKPGSCGSCPFFFSGSTHLCTNKGRGICTLFNEMHQLFNKAFRMPNGSNLVIVMQ